MGGGGGGGGGGGAAALGCFPACFPARFTFGAALPFALFALFAALALVVGFPFAWYRPGYRPLAFAVAAALALGCFRSSDGPWAKVHFFHEHASPSARPLLCQWRQSCVFTLAFTLASCSAWPAGWANQHPSRVHSRPKLQARSARGGVGVGVGTGGGGGGGGEGGAGGEALGRSFTPASSCASGTGGQGIRGGPSSDLAFRAVRLEPVRAQAAPAKGSSRDPRLRPIDR